jgi:hypothetical protein
MSKAKSASTKKVKDTANALPPSWELAIADAEAEISRLHRSIEMFKHNQKMGVPFPAPATQN